MLAQFHEVFDTAGFGRDVVSTDPSRVFFGAGPAGQATAADSPIVAEFTGVWVGH